MINRLPAWVWLAGAGLAAVAGAVNAVGLLGFSQRGLSYLSGTASTIGIDAAAGRWAQAGRLGLIVAAFVAGAAASGALIRGTSLRPGRRYGAALLAESSLLALAIPLLTRHPGVGELLLSGACGLQNAMVSTYSGAIVRTTHVSGTLTDVGVLLGRALRGGRLEARRLSLLLSLVGGFVAGGAFGAWRFGPDGPGALWTPVAFTALLAAAALAHRWWWRAPAER